MITDRYRPKSDRTFPLQIYALPKKKFAIWKYQYLESKRQALLSAGANRLFELNTKKKCFAALLEELEKSRAAAKLGDAIVRRKDAVLVKSMYSGWRSLFQRVLEEKRRSRFEALEITATAFERWALFVDQRKQKRNKLIQADRLYDKAMGRWTKSMLKSWVKFVGKARKNRQNEKRVQEKKTRRIYEGVFRTLKEHSVRALKEKTVKVVEQHLEVQV